MLRPLCRSSGLYDEEEDRGESGVVGPDWAGEVASSTDLLFAGGVSVSTLLLATCGVAFSTDLLLASAFNASTWYARSA